MNPDNWNEMSMTFTPQSANGNWDFTVTVNGRSASGDSAFANLATLEAFEWAIHPWNGSAQKDFANIRIFAGANDPGTGTQPGILPTPPPLTPAAYFITVHGNEHTNYHLTHEYGVVGSPAGFGPGGFTPVDSRIRLHASDWGASNSRFRFWIEGLNFTPDTEYVVEWNQFVNASSAMDVRFWSPWLLFHYFWREPSPPNIWRPI